MNNSTYLNSKAQPMTAAAFHSLHAARLFSSIGRDAAIRFAMKRAGISYSLALRLITLARQLMAMDRVQQLDFTL